jgi:hypothetical protein
MVPGPSADLADKPESEAPLGEVGLRSAAAHPTSFRVSGFSTHDRGGLRLTTGPTSTGVWWFIFGNSEATEERHHLSVNQTRDSRVLRLKGYPQ